MCRRSWHTACRAEGRGWFEQCLGPDVKFEWFVYNAGPIAMEAIFADWIDLTYVGPSPAINFAWRSLMAAEFFVTILSGFGLRQLLHYGRELNAMERAIGIMVVIVVIGLLADKMLFAPWERFLHRRWGTGASRTEEVSGSRFVQLMLRD